MSNRTLYRLFGTLSVSSLAWLGWNMGNPESDIPGCLFLHFTGVPCPSCGITHSMADIVQLRFADAVHDNILGFPATAMLVIVSLLILTDIAFKKQYFISCYRRMEIILQKNFVLSSFLVVLVTINWAYHIMTQ